MVIDEATSRRRWEAALKEVKTDEKRPTKLQSTIWGIPNRTEWDLMYEFYKKVIEDMHQPVNQVEFTWDVSDWTKAHGYNHSASTTSESIHNQSALRGKGGKSKKGSNKVQHLRIWTRWETGSYKCLVRVQRDPMSSQAVDGRVYCHIRASNKDLQTALKAEYPVADRFQVLAAIWYAIHDSPMADKKIATEFFKKAEQEE